MSHRESRRSRSGVRRQGRSSPRSLVRRMRTQPMPTWNGNRIYQLLGAYFHDPESLVNVVKNFTKEEILNLHAAARVTERAAVPYYRVCSQLLPSISWARRLHIYHVVDSISWEPLESFSGGCGLHYRHRCIFGAGYESGHGNLQYYGRDILTTMQDERTCSIEIDLFTQSPHFRGLSSIQHLDIDEVREVMHVKTFVRIGDVIVSDTALVVGGGIGLEDMAVDERDLATIARALGLEPTPLFAQEFSHVIYCMAMSMVGRKWGVTAHDAFSRLIFVERDHFLNSDASSSNDDGAYSSDNHTHADKEVAAYGQSISHENEQHHHQHHHHHHHHMFDEGGSVAEAEGYGSDESSDTECCEAKRFAVEFASRNSQLAEIIFQYVNDPADVWRSLRFHLGSSGVREFREGVDTLALAVDFYDATRRECKLAAIPWIDGVAVSQVSAYVDSEIKGSHECGFRCDFTLGGGALGGLEGSLRQRLFKCALVVEGSFSGPSTQIKNKKKSLHYGHSSSGNMSRRNKKWAGSSEEKLRGRDGESGGCSSANHHHRRSFPSSYSFSSSSSSSSSSSANPDNSGQYQMQLYVDGVPMNRPVDGYGRINAGAVSALVAQNRSFLSRVMATELGDSSSSPSSSSHTSGEDFAFELSSVLWELLKHCHTEDSIGGGGGGGGGASATCDNAAVGTVLCRKNNAATRFRRVALIRNYSSPASNPFYSRRSTAILGGKNAWREGEEVTNCSSNGIFYDDGRGDYLEIIRGEKKRSSSATSRSLEGLDAGPQQTTWKPRRLRTYSHKS